MAGVISKNIGWVSSKLKNKKNQRDRNLWIFGEWFGNRCCDNSLYLANYVAKAHPELKLVWIAKEGADMSLLAPSVEVVQMDTPQAQDALKHAGVVVMNQGRGDCSELDPFLCEGAFLVNLWHGVPWKHIGLDGSRNFSALKRLYEKYYLWLHRVNAYVTLSEDFSRIMARAFHLKKKDVIHAGYPRNSIFYQRDQVETIRKKVIAALQKENNSLDDAVKVITYMPTFRDNTQEVFSFQKLAADPRLTKMLEEYNAVIVQRAHFVSAQRNGADIQTENPRIMALNGITSQELLAATDLLITDYSSCFFDYLMLDRPIVHYLYDYAYYLNEDRGLYYKKEEVACGDVAQTEQELLLAMEQNLSDPEKQKALRADRRGKYMTFESEDSCRIICEEIRKRQN